MMRIFSSAKLNLSLHVGKKLPDGFHEVDTVMQTVSFGDTITLEVSEATDLTCSDPSVPLDNRNLVFQAVSLFQKNGLLKNGFRIHIDRQIPMMSGLGGASSNAAATLRGMNELCQIGLSEQDLLSFARELGCDVPACVLGGTVHGTHYGEMVSRLEALPPYWFVIVDTGVQVNTTEAYQWWDESKSNESCTHVTYTPTLDWIKHGSNDFERLVANQFSEIHRDLTMLREHGALRASLTGSGGNVYGVFTSEKTALKAVQHFSRAWVCVPVLSPKSFSSPAPSR